MIANWLAQRFELARGGEQANLPPMEGLRGFAVFLVFLVHYVTLGEPWIVDRTTLYSIANGLRAIGHTGVDLFFVLSGYLIYGSLISRPQPYLRFIARRVERIYPAFLAVFVLYFALSVLFPAESKLPSSPLLGAVYVAENLAFLPGLLPIEPLITVAWSLSYEMFFYLVTPLLIGMARLRYRRPIWRGVFIASLAAAFALYCSVYGGPVRLIMFLAGALLHETIASARAPHPAGAFSIVAVALAFAITAVPTTGSAAYALKVCGLFLAFGALCFSCFTAPHSALSQFFSWTPLRWLGNMSYSYYLLHGLTLKAAFYVVRSLGASGEFGSLLFIGLLPGMFLATLVPAAILFLLIERPFSLARATRNRAPSSAYPKTSIEAVKGA